MMHSVATQTNAFVNSVRFLQPITLQQRVLISVATSQRQLVKEKKQNEEPFKKKKDFGCKNATVSNHRFVGASGFQLSKSNCTYRSRPTIQNFHTFLQCHGQITPNPLLTTARLGKTAAILWACVKHVPSGLTFSHFVPVLKTGS